MTEIDDKNLEKLAKSIHKMDDQQGEALKLASNAGDHYEGVGKLQQASDFYQLAFNWDQNNEDMFIKLFKVLGKQGKTIKSMRAIMDRIKMKLAGNKSIHLIDN